MFSYIYFLDIERNIRILRRSKLNRRGLVIITTYEGIRKHKRSLGMLDWHGICLDEGQKIRNPTADITTYIKTLASCHRLILSGK